MRLLDPSLLGFSGNLVTIDADGVVTSGNTPGTANIVVSVLANTAVTDALNLTIAAAPTAGTPSLTISPDPLVLRLGRVGTVSAAVTTSTGGVFDVSNNPGFSIRPIGLLGIVGTALTAILPGTATATADFVGTVGGEALNLTDTFQVDVRLLF